MSNELIKVTDAERFRVLSTGNDFSTRLEEAKELGLSFSASDFTRVKVPPEGRTTWTIDTPMGAVNVNEIVGVLLHSEKQATLWPSERAVEGSIPVLVSRGAKEFDPDPRYGPKIARQIGQMPEELRESCEPFRLIHARPGHTAVEDEVKAIRAAHMAGAEVPRELREKYVFDTFDVSEVGGFLHNQWDTGRNGVGKRMREVRSVYLQPFGQDTPIHINIPVTSVKAWDTMLKDALYKMGVPIRCLLVKLTLQKATAGTGEVYGQIVPTIAGTVDMAIANTLQEMWGALINRDAATAGGAVKTTEGATEATEAPQGDTAVPAENESEAYEETVDEQDLVDDAEDAEFEPVV